MTTESLVCWKCGAPLAEELLPLARIAECPACNADLHVCRLCEFYDTRVAKACREPVADKVNNKERANFCDYFQPRPGAWSAPGTQAADASRQALDALFGDGGEGGKSATDGTRGELDDLFGGGQD